MEIHSSPPNTGNSQKGNQKVRKSISASIWYSPTDLTAVRGGKKPLPCAQLGLDFWNNKERKE